MHQIHNFCKPSSPGLKPGQSHKNHVNSITIMAGPAVDCHVVFKEVPTKGLGMDHMEYVVLWLPLQACRRPSILYLISP